MYANILRCFGSQLQVEHIRVWALGRDSCKNVLPTILQVAPSTRMTNSEDLELEDTLPQTVSLIIQPSTSTLNDEVFGS